MGFFAVSIVGYLYYQYSKGQDAIKKLRVKKIEESLEEIDNENDKKSLSDLVDIANDYHSKRKNGHDN